MLIKRVPLDEPLSAAPAAAAGDDGLRAERAWCDGHTLAAMATADRVLAGGDDPGSRAAGVAAAAAAADGALLDAAQRWRGVAGALRSDEATPAAVWANGRAALSAGLAGDVVAARRALERARADAPDPTPRGLAVLLAGVTCVVEAFGDTSDALDIAAHRLTGLAAVTVPADPLNVDRWDELAVTLVAATGDDRAAQQILAGRPSPRTPRQQLLGSWLQLRTGHLSAAREELGAATSTPTLRRNAVLAAAITVGLARRSGNDHLLATTWQQVAAVVAGAEVEPFLLDVWGELAVGAQRVSPADRDAIVNAMRAAVSRAGSPWWAVATGHHWSLELAIAADDVAAATAAATAIAELAGRHPALQVRADAAAAWVRLLSGRVETPAVTAVVRRLAEHGRRWEAAALCQAAISRTADPTAARELLGAGRTLRVATAPGRAGGELSDREREVGTLVLDGLTHKEIGARLYISPRTVEQHVARLRQKLAAGNRAALVAALRTCLPG